VSVSENGSRGGLTTAEIRGGDPTFTLVLVDGVPLNDGTDSEGDIYNLAGLSLDEVERVEIVRGPLSSLHGSRALSGVIQIFSRQASGAGVRGDGAASVGSFADRRASAGIGATRGRRSGTLRVGGEREAGRVGRDDYSALRLLGAAGLPVAGGDLRLRLRYAAWDANDYPDASGGPLLGDGGLRESRSKEGSLSLHWSLADGQRRRHGLDLAAVRHSLERESPAIGTAVPASSQATGLTRLRLGWSGGFALGKSLKLAAGADLEDERADNETRLRLGPGVELPAEYASRRTTGGAFAGLAEARGRVAYDVGLRVDLPEGYRAQLSPRASLSWKPRVGPWRLRGSYGRGFKVPSFYAVSSPRAIGGNPDLGPETSAGGDLGVDVESKRMSVSLSAYLVRYRDLIDFDFSVLQLVNRSEVRSRGVELAVAWRPAKAWSLRGTLTHQDSRDAASDGPLLHQPRWLASGFVAWSPAAALRVAFGSRGQSSGLDRQIPVPGRDRVAGYGILSAWGAWRFLRGAAIEGRCDNLADRRYETLIGFPGPRRSLEIGLRLGGE
jgi:vitamin B12 transporter